MSFAAILVVQGEKNYELVFFFFSLVINSIFLHLFTGLRPHLPLIFLQQWSMQCRRVSRPRKNNIPLVYAERVSSTWLRLFNWQLYGLAFFISFFINKKYKNKINNYTMNFFFHTKRKNFMRGILVKHKVHPPPHLLTLYFYEVK